MKAYRITKSVATSDDLKKINQFARRELTSDEVYVFSVTLCDNDVDRDFEKFTVETLNKMQPMFIGKTGILDHDPSAENQNSRIFETWVEKTNDKTKDGEPLYQLKAKAYVFKSEKTQTLIDEIDAGIKKEVSVSGIMKKSVCSICGADLFSEGCEHIRGKEYDGKLCYFTLEEPEDVYEFSFVAIPAQRNAGVTKSFDIQKGRECRKAKMLFDNVGIVEIGDYTKDGLHIIEEISEKALNNTKLNDIVYKNGDTLLRAKDGNIKFKQYGDKIYFELSEKPEGDIYIAYKPKAKTVFERQDGEISVYRRTIEAVEKIYTISADEGVTEKSINALLDGVIKQAQAERLARLKAKRLEAKKQIARNLIGG